MDLNWNVNKYTSDFSFVHKYGSDLIEMIESPKNDSTVILDLGCGNGALSKELKDTGFKVIGIDASEDFLDLARNNYPEIEFIQADATDFALDEPVDVVFSNAVFHWIDKDKHDDMLKCVYEVLKPGGEFIFEFGGYHNNRLIHKALKKVFALHGHDYEIPFYFPSIGEYASLLEKHNFKVVYATLFDRPTELLGEDGLKNWLEMFIKTPFDTISQEEKEAIIEQTVEELKDDLYIDGKWYSDYVRLRIKAIRE